MKKIKAVDLHGAIAKWNMYNGFPMTIDEVYELYKSMKERNFEDGYIKVEMDN